MLHPSACRFYLLFSYLCSVNITILSNEHYWIIKLAAAGLGESEEKEGRGCARAQPTPCFHPLQSSIELPASLIPSLSSQTHLLCKAENTPKQTDSASMEIFHK